MDNKKLKNHLLNLIKQVCEGDVKDVLDKEKTKEHIYGIYVYINGNKK